LIFDEYGKWKGPYTDVEISPLREKIKSELPKDYFIVSNKAHSIEHSIEALIPFLQYYNRDIKITPVMVTQNSFERMDSISTYLSKIISEYASENKLKPGKDIFFLISNDANHYGEDFDNSPFGLDLNAHRSATENDKRIINENFSGRIDRDKILGITKELLPDSSNQKNIPLWCGRYPIILGLFTMQKNYQSIIKGGNQRQINKVFRHTNRKSFTDSKLKYGFNRNIFSKTLVRLVHTWNLFVGKLVLNY
jgi:AmmeMemoRadiSam system protein B